MYYLRIVPLLRALCPLNVRVICSAHVLNNIPNPRPSNYRLKSSGPPTPSAPLAECRLHPADQQRASAARAAVRLRSEHATEEHLLNRPRAGENDESAIRLFCDPLDGILEIGSAAHGKCN